MATIDRQESVMVLLKNFRGLEPLKQLFWSELNYQRINQPLSRRGWSDTTANLLADDPLLFAGGGESNDFHVIYTRMGSDRLPLGHERPVVSRLTKDHPYSLFIVSNRNQDFWHFINVKFDKETEKRRQFRRITVGPDERLRTASERLALLDLSSISPDLFGPPPLTIQERHDDAFDVEAVTKEFFHLYGDVFYGVEESITGFEESKEGKETRHLFTQQLFNRLLFVAFIQKKGWLKIDGRTDYLAALWANYEKARDKGNNFYQQRLQTLFFSGLNNAGSVNIIGINRGGFLGKLIGEVPYLNGGLFEENELDKVKGITVPDKSIQSILFSLFGRFNFTVSESTPLDQEVAVDPEMLGTIFEELITGRHEQGAYYTPKPIVSFMCREALKGYLQSKCESETKTAVDEFVENHDPSLIRKPEAVLDALRTVTICDPACGSGAYLLGMLHELMDLRNCLFVSHKIGAKDAYDRKLEIIQNNLYGVDIDPFAVNIARLRLWLSLAVEFGGENGETPPPLPNLEFKIEVGDSLTAPNPQAANTLFEHKANEIIGQLVKLKGEYLRTHSGRKRTIAERIEKGEQDLQRILRSEPIRPGAFDWRIRFAEVFADGGFCIAVANPPYVRQELIKEIKPNLSRVYPDFYCGTADLYCYFYGRSVQILRPSGMLVFISSNKWFRAKYGQNLRNYMATRCFIHSITDFGELPVFEASATFPMILVAQKNGEDLSNAKTIFTQVKTLGPPYPDVREIVNQSGQQLPKDAIQGATWALTDTKSVDLLQKMEKAGLPLGDYVKGRIYYGIKTGFNKAFVIDGETRRALIAEDSKSKEIIHRLAMGDDIRKWRIEQEDRWLIVTRIGIDIERYPAIFKHLKQYQKSLEKRWDKGDHWWELRACAYYDAFSKPKIILPDIAKESRFTFDSEGYFLGNTGYLISNDELFLLGVLNSSCVWRFAVERFQCLGDPKKGGRFRFIYQSLVTIPIPKAPAPDRSKIETLVKSCLKARGQGCDTLEREIDEIVYRLYGLTKEEIKIVEGGR